MQVESIALPAFERVECAGRYTDASCLYWRHTCSVCTGLVGSIPAFMSLWCLLASLDTSVQVLSSMATVVFSFRPLSMFKAAGMLRDAQLGRPEA
jgi:hypothetical protein